MSINDIIEYIVLGAASITCFYHTILYFHQRDKFLLLYANYLFSLTVYLIFRRVSNYDSFEYSMNKLGFAIDYTVILYMLVSYVYFISKVLEANNQARIIKLAVVLFYTCASILFVIHLYKIFFTNECYLTRTFFLVSKLSLSTCAFLGLIGAWFIRKTIFIRTIIIGGLAYAICSLMSILSIYFEVKILGLFQYQIYFIGCLIDILIFSSALGYRNYLNQQARMEAQELLVLEGNKNSELIQIQHDILHKENEQHQRQLAMQESLQYEVGACLSSIHIFAELVLQKEGCSKESLVYIQQIASQTQDLMDNMGDMIWLANLNLEKDLHQQFISRVKDYGQELVQAKQKACEYKLNPYFQEAILSKEFLKEQIFRIKEAMKQFVEKGVSQSLTIIFDCDRQRPFITIVE